jgi:hypothetical protein
MPLEEYYTIFELRFFLCFVLLKDADWCAVPLIMERRFSSSSLLPLLLSLATLVKLRIR